MEYLPEGPPVSVTKIKFLISQLRRRMTPGADLIPLELMKDKIERWVPTLVLFLTYIDITGCVPKDWAWQL